ncbi:hypothetical protein GINT2_000146 [Glugoides intestinalis]
MSIKDVCFLAIVDTSKKIHLSCKYNEIDTDALLAAMEEETGDVFIFKEQTVFVSRMNEICVLLVAMPDSNEIFVSAAFEALVASLSKIIKNWTIDRISEKYDQLVLVFHEFVFKGIILIDQSEELNSRVMKRSFENVNAIKVNKGFASFLNKATKSLRK